MKNDTANIFGCEIFQQTELSFDFWMEAAWCWDKATIDLENTSTLYLFYDENKPQSSRLTRGLLELVQHFRLNGEFTSEQERCLTQNLYGFDPSSELAPL